MENSAKALLMAGGVLVTMLIVALLFYFKGKITEYYDDQGKIDDIANVAEFNKQFTNYERKKVYGYELVSLANMVEDYNTRHSGAQEAPNDEKYTPFTLVITFEGSGTAVQEKIWYDDEGGVNHLFNNNEVLTQSETSNQVVNRILKATEIENLYGVSETTKLAKSINKLIVKEDENDYQVQKIKEEQKCDTRKSNINS